MQKKSHGSAEVHRHDAVGRGFLSAVVTVVDSQVRAHQRSGLLESRTFRCGICLSNRKFVGDLRCRVAWLYSFRLTLHGVLPLAEFSQQRRPVSTRTSILIL